MIQNQATELRGLARQTPTASQNVVPLRQVNRQSLIAVVGACSGVGTTTIARQLATRLTHPQVTHSPKIVKS